MSIETAGSGSLATVAMETLLLGKVFSRGSRMFVRCGVFFPVDHGCLLGVGVFFFTVSRIFFTFLRVNFSRIFSVFTCEFFT